QGPGDEPRLGLVPAPALQGPPVGDDGGRAAGRPTVDRQRRAADGSGSGRDRQRVLRRHGSSPPRGADDAGEGPRSPQGGRGHRVSEDVGSGLAHVQGLPPSTLDLAADGLGPDLLPIEALADCAATVLARDGKTILSYGAAQGYTPLRELIAEWFGV